MKYHIYMNDDLIDSTDTNHVSLTGLKPDTLYKMRVTFVIREEEIMAFDDYSTTTLPIYS
ncbi:hypothetical protein [Solibacillus sp. R5-41]|uniref:hypothetical protein n=1 Tax=Solibacillus sp. R5-41 TaxID=2048654 RepID=UPI0012FE2483|nr:hypothetical protein [Solibacillus sp. R5-41]